MGTPGVVVLAAVTCIGGWLLGRATSNPEPQLPPVQGPAAAADPAWADLAREVRRLSERVDALAQAGSTRTPLTGSGESEAVARLEAVIRELSALVASLHGMAPELAADPAIHAAATGGTSARYALQNAIARRVAGLEWQAYAAEREVARQELLANHRMWTIPQLVARYGIPDRWHPSDSGVQLQYDFEKTQDVAHGYMKFLVSEGYVIEAYLEISP